MTCATNMDRGDVSVIQPVRKSPMSPAVAPRCHVKARAARRMRPLEEGMRSSLRTVRPARAPDAADVTDSSTPHTARPAITPPPCAPPQAANAKMPSLPNRLACAPAHAVRGGGVRGCGAVPEPGGRRAWSQSVTPAPYALATANTGAMPKAASTMYHLSCGYSSGMKAAPSTANTP